MSNENREDDHPALSEEDQARVDHFIRTGVNATEKAFPAHSARGFIDYCGHRLQFAEPDISAYGGGLLS